MKTFFVLCAVLSVAVSVLFPKNIFVFRTNSSEILFSYFIFHSQFANAMPDLKDSEFEVLDLFKAKKSDFPFTDEQVQCLEVRFLIFESFSHISILYFNRSTIHNYLCK